MFRVMAYYKGTEGDTKRERVKDFENEIKGFGLLVIAHIILCITENSWSHILRRRMDKDGEWDFGKEA